jgi:signal transduction histidine kinase
MSQMTLTLMGRRPAIWIFALFSLGAAVVGLTEWASGAARPFDLAGYSLLTVLGAILSALVHQQRMGVLLAQRVAVFSLIAFLVGGLLMLWFQPSTPALDAYVLASAAPWLLACEFMLFLCLPPGWSAAVVLAVVLVTSASPWLAQAPAAALAQALPLLMNAAVVQLMFGGLLWLVASQVRRLAAQSVAGLQGDSVPHGTGGRGELSLVELAGRRERELQRLLAHAEAARQTAAAHEAELLAMLNAFPGVVLRVEADGSFGYANEQAACLFGRSANDLLGRQASDVVGSNRYASFVARTQQIVASGQPVSFEATITADNGSATELLMTQFVVQQDPVDISLDPPAAAQARVVYQIGVDIGQRKRAERDLAYAKAEAERANQAKSRFMSRMSHELRTPLNAVLGLAQLLRVQAPQLDSTQRSHLRTIANSGKDLLALVDETMDLSRMDSGEMRVTNQAVNLTQLITAALESVTPLAHAQGVHLAPPPASRALWVQADPVRLRQVLLNLLSNAVKYNRPAGAVAVRVSSREGQAQIVVQDTGKGLSTQQQAQLFQPFNRLGAELTATPGTGIGLSIANGLVKLMQGRLDVRSQPGVGSEFMVWLPLTAAPAPQPAEATRSDLGPLAEDRQVQGKVLYVEDNDVNILVFDAVLKRRPEVRLFVARDAQEALDIAAQHALDLVVLDLNLAGCSGLDVADKLRACEGAQALPMVLLTADATPETAALAKTRGITQVWHKPFDAARLLSDVDTLLGRELV